MLSFHSNHLYLLSLKLAKCQNSNPALLFLLSYLCTEKWDLVKAGLRIV